MNATEKASATRLRVIDALDHPHGDRILRTRLVEGAPPSIRRLKGARLQAHGPDGRTGEVTVLGFPVFGGKPSDRRIEETGRIDLVVEAEGEGAAVSRTWVLSFAGD